MDGQKEDIAFLKAEIESLKSKVTALEKTQDRDFVEINNLIKEVYTNAYQYIADIHDIIRPIEQKIFPNARQTRKQIEAIVGKAHLQSRLDLDKKNR